jgi:ribonuclease H2 subunit B
VYRFSPAHAVEYMQKKVERLSQREVIERSRTVTRSLAKDGLMEDGKEILLDSKWSHLASCAKL